MGINDIFNKIRAGANTAMSNHQFVFSEFQEFSSSSQRKWMLTGDRYYRGLNDIRYNSGDVDMLASELVDSDGKSDSKLAHSYMKLMVDEKINYLLSKPYSLTSNDEKFLENVKQVLGKRFPYTLTRLGYESSNKGIGWLQVYVDQAGKMKFMVIPSEQCIPIWCDNSHEELEGMIRSYEVVTFEGSRKKVVTKIEYWTAYGLEYLEVHEGKLVEDIGWYMRHGIEGNDSVSHYTVNNEKRYWGKVPFIPFKNNMLEYCDLRFVKTLIDNYDMSRSEVGNFIDDVRNLIFVLRGYGGSDLKEFMSDLKRYRAIKIDDPADGGVDTLNPNMDISAAMAHYERLDSDIEKFAQCIPKNFEKLGNDPSGVAMKFHYSGIDLKANALETEFKFGFESLMYFVKVYLNDAGKGNYADSDIDIVFGRDVAVNEAATIDALGKSSNMLSKKTLLSQHPWIHDVEKELELLEAEKAAVEPVTAPVEPLN